MMARKTDREAAAWWRGLAALLVIGLSVAGSTSAYLARRLTEVVVPPPAVPLDVFSLHFDATRWVRRHRPHRRVGLCPPHDPAGSSAAGVRSR
ncbi:MAG: hypothetical protein ACT4QD_22890 [Acidobacteriota bacterium]